MINGKLLSARLRQIRKKKGFSATYVSRRTGIHVATIYQMELGANKDFRLLNHLVPLCKCYGYSVQLLIASVEKKDAETTEKK